MGGAPRTNQLASRVELMQIADANPFTCTFCHELCAGPPHILGRCARLACGACHTAILDLSICWVCGELIVRNSECVSFGWCFWHRACFGCLLYGSRPVHGSLQARRPQEGQTEVLEPPLCAVCLVDVEADGLAREQVVARGLRTTAAVDGGITQQRWETKESRRRSHSPCAGSLGDVDGDGPPAEATIWVNLFDPINYPSFKPSPLKPIPRFMQPRRCSSSRADHQLDKPAPSSPGRSPATRKSTEAGGGGVPFE